MESNQPIYRAPKIPKLNKKIISSSVLSGAPKLRITKIGMPISKIGVGKNQSRVVVGQSPIAPESLLSIANAVDSIAGGLKRVTEMFVREGEVEQKEQKEREKREKREEENKRRKVKESGLEKGIANFLLSPVKAVAGKAQGVLSSLMEFFTLLFVGWLTDKGLSAIRMNAEGNTKGLEELRNTVLKNLAIVGGTLAALNTGFFGIAGLIAGIAGGILGWLGSNTIGKLFDRLRGVRPPAPPPMGGPGGGPGGSPRGGAAGSPGGGPTPTPQIGQNVPVIGPNGKPILGSNGKPLTSPVVHYEPRSGMVDGIRKNLTPRAVTAFEIAKNPRATAAQIESLMRYELQQSGGASGKRLGMAQFRSQMRMKYGYGFNGSLNFGTGTMDIPRGPYRPTLSGFDDVKLRYRNDLRVVGRSGSQQILEGFGQNDPRKLIQRAPDIPSSRAAMTAEVFGESRAPSIPKSTPGGIKPKLNIRGGVRAGGGVIGIALLVPTVMEIVELVKQRRYKDAARLTASTGISMAVFTAVLGTTGAAAIASAIFSGGTATPASILALTAGATAATGASMAAGAGSDLLLRQLGLEDKPKPKPKKPQKGGPGIDGSSDIASPIPAADITPISGDTYIPQQQTNPEPQIIYRRSGSGQQSQGTSLKSGSATNVPMISSSNPDNFYVLYSQVNYNVVV